MVIDQPRVRQLELVVTDFQQPPAAAGAIDAEAFAAPADDAQRQLAECLDALGAVPVMRASTAGRGRELPERTASGLADGSKTGPPDRRRALIAHAP